MSLERLCSLALAQSLSLRVEDLRSTLASSSCAASLSTCSCSESADNLEVTVPRIDIEGSLFLLSKPKLFPTDCLLLCPTLGVAGVSLLVNVSVGETALASDVLPIVEPEDLLFSHSPSFSIRLLTSIDERALGACSLIEAMLVVLSECRWLRAEGGLGEPMLIIEEMLLSSECPRTVDIEPSVSEEMVESGRGMISTLSEKPTRGRDTGLVGEESRSESSVLFSASVTGIETDLSRTRCSGSAVAGCSSGVLGRLELSLGTGSLGCMMLLAS